MPPGNGNKEFNNWVLVTSAFLAGITVIAFGGRHPAYVDIAAFFAMAAFFSWVGIWAFTHWKARKTRE